MDIVIPKSAAELEKKEVTKDFVDNDFKRESYL